MVGALAVLAVSDAAMTNRDDGLSFNFWPSFADLMLALVLILVLVLALVTTALTLGTVNLSHVQERQRAIIASIANAYSVPPRQVGDSRFAIAVPGASDALTIQNEPQLQQFTFSDRLLFDPDEFLIKPEGKELLKVVGATLRGELAAIKEVQIQGHADPDPSARFQTNLELAARRAVEVFRFLQEDVGIDPTRHLMSITSFGEYKPITRLGTETYNAQILAEDNKTVEHKARNRRIEILLFYHLN
jgi:flagellar motor protein MotB